MDKVVHFEIPADNVDRAQSFYKEVFNWNIITMPQMQYTLVYTGPTNDKAEIQEKGFINGGMLKRQEPIKNPVITIDVDSIEAASEKILQHGGEVIRGKMDVGEMGYSAYFKDSEGNVLGLWENK